MSAADPGTPIFNGRDLAGWDGDPRFWSVADGAIVGRTTAQVPTAENTFLIWRDGEVDDFELTLSYRIEGGNSGIQYRSTDLGGWVVGGYQADCEDGDEWSGCLYEERGRGVLAPRGTRITVGPDGRPRDAAIIGDKAALMTSIDRAGWNRYRITARGHRLTHAINDVAMSEVIDEQPDKRRRSGVLALQLHAGPPMTVRFTDIRLKRLPLENAKKIVLVAGEASHGDGEHEFPAGVHCLRRCLDGVPGVIAADYYHGWPADPTAWDNADAVLFYMDGGGGHPIVQDERLQTLAALMKRGVGMACVHYACEVPAERGGAELKDWIGGYYETGWSINPHWDADFSEIPDHPITRGVRPFTINDEWYFNMRFRDPQDRVTWLLRATPPDATRGTDETRRHPGRSEITSWAAERTDGGRGFGFTGGHFHRNWAQADFRRLVLNALLWTAHVEVPANGVESAPSDDDMNRRLRNRPTSQAPAGAPDVAGAAFVSPIVREGTVDIDVDLADAKGLWLVVDDGGNGYGCDWADWIEPRVVTDSGEVKLTDLTWTAGWTGWGQPRVGLNCEGGALKVGGQPVAYGIGVHADSLLRYDLPAGAKRFVARAGIDNGGTDQRGGAAVRFLVFTSEPKIAAGPRQRPSGAQTPDDTLVLMDVADGCAVGLFAHEPMLTNPTNIDVDHRGRVWVTEGMNYRQWHGTRPEGDRIVILEDADGDGRAEKSTVFYQGKDIDAALGICVLGDKVIVSRSPHILVFTDADGDDRPEKKEILFAGIGGEQHDHGAHAVVFGPDGRLYFNVGNNGERLRARDGAELRDRAGNVVDGRGQPYRQGMVFRCELDGSGLETLGWNFRNNYEVCVDSFGTLWQSDNDDDGNQGVRINYVMEYGNFGYVDEMTGAGWNDDRTGIEAEIPRRHWHQDDPGVVPNLLLTGGGSPTGICVYEGDLLPAVFRGQLVHTDAGPNTCRAYPVTASGAGWSARMVDLLTADDSWYRPSDCCVGPDGSLYVADWYDPGVGGHAMGDNTPATMRGRIYRVAPTGHKPDAGAIDVATPDGAVAALRSPNQAARFLGWRALSGFGVAAQPALVELWGDADPRLRARALWLLAALPDQAQRWIDAGATEGDPDLRVVALRIARQRGDDVVTLVERLIDDPSA
ncbi:MAG: DUF1080 domain-containing protein, partial [Planctomycetes bacterium]|nr:DUF1080 domain-containing protein [Planctomycetota bacterium]